MHKGAKNTTGYYSVGKYVWENSKTGWIYRYRYFVDGKLKYISSINLDVLEEKVKAKGLPWYRVDKNGERIGGD